MRPLYVNGAETRVVLDGPALRISTPNSADRWFPLRWLSRVVSSNQVDWALEAVLACASRGVTVSFLDAGGSLIARCIGKVTANAELQESLEAFLLRDDWQSLYAQWLAAAENMAMRSVLRRSGLKFDSCPGAPALRSLFREGAVSLNALSAYERMGRETYSLLLALTTQMLTDSELDAARFNTREFNLAADFAEVLFWDFQLGRLRYLENRLERMETMEAPPHEQTVAHFESRRERTEKLARGLIRRLHRWLIELD